MGVGSGDEKNLEVGGHKAVAVGLEEELEEEKRDRDEDRDRDHDREKGTPNDEEPSNVFLPSSYDHWLGVSQICNLYSVFMSYPCLYDEISLIH